MGQQQLLLVILVTILVGIATLVAINVFGGAADEANRDAVRQDLLQGASSAQAIWTRPETLGGAQYDFSNLTEAELLRRLNMPVIIDPDAPTVATNENGTFRLVTAAIGATSLTIQGEPASGGDNILAIVCRDDDDNWRVNVGDGTVDDPCEAEDP